MRFVILHVNSQHKGVVESIVSPFLAPISAPRFPKRGTHTCASDGPTSRCQGRAGVAGCGRGIAEAGKATGRRAGGAAQASAVLSDEGQGRDRLQGGSGVEVCGGTFQHYVVKSSMLRIGRYLVCRVPRPKGLYVVQFQSYFLDAEARAQISRLIWTTTSLSTTQSRSKNYFCVYYMNSSKTLGRALGWDLQMEQPRRNL